MKKHYALKDVNMKKYYIVTRPTRLSDLTFDELEDETNSKWREKARQLQARRWRRIKQQLA
jgi:hypothetical protein